MGVWPRGSCKTELPCSVRAAVFLLFLLDDWVFRLIKKLVPEATVLPARIRTGKRSSTANWNCHGAGAGICYNYMKPSRLFGVKDEGEPWSGQDNNLSFKHSFLLAEEGRLNLFLQQWWYVSYGHINTHLWRMPFLWLTEKWYFYKHVFDWCTDTSFSPKSKALEFLFVEARTNGGMINFIDFNIHLKYFIIPWETGSFTYLGKKSWPKQRDKVRTRKYFSEPK